MVSPLSELSAEVSVKSAFAVEVSTQTCESLFASSCKSVVSLEGNSLVETNTTDVKGQTEVSGEPAVSLVLVLTVVVHVVAFASVVRKPLVIGYTFVRSEVISQVDVEADTLRKLPSTFDTSTQNRRVAVTCIEVTHNTSTRENDEVPYASVAVTAEDVAQVEQNVTSNNAITTSCVGVGNETKTVHVRTKARTLLCGIETEVLALQDAVFPVNLQTKTETRSKPLTKSYVNTIGASVVPVLLEELRSVRILDCHVCTNLYEPVVPETVSSNGVLRRCFDCCLCISCYSTHAGESQRNQ